MRWLSIITAVCMLTAHPAPSGARADDAGERENVTALPTGERAIEVVVDAPGTVAEAWALWTTPEGFELFLGVDSKVELRVGGPFELYFAPDSPPGERGSEGCRVLSYTAHEMLSFSWSAPPSIPSVRAAEKTVVVITFERLAPGIVRTRLVHHGWGEGEDWDKAFEYFRRAWGGVLGAMRAHLEAVNGTEPDRESDWRGAWVYFIRTARPEAARTPNEEEARLFEEHFEYLAEARREGRVVLAGPCTDFVGPGIVVFHAQSEADARAFMEGDPGVEHALFRATLHPLYLSLVRGVD